MYVTPLAAPRYFHLRLEPGVSIQQSLRQFMESERLTRAFVLSTIGSVREAVINYPLTDTQPPEVGHDTLNGLYEINGIAGEVWREAGEIRVHLHGSVTHRASSVYGGGLGDLVVFKLAEMVILGLGDEASRPA